MSLRPKLQLTALDFSEGCADIKGKIIPLNRLKIRVEKSKIEPNVLNVVARQKIWPWGRVSKDEQEELNQFLNSKQLEYAHSHNQPVFDQEPEEVHNGREDSEGTPNQPIEGG